MPIGVTSEALAETRKFNETFARQIAAAASNEDTKRMDAVRARREAMRSAFNDSKAAHRSATATLAAKHTADLARFAALKAKYAAIEQAAAAAELQIKEQRRKRDEKDAQRGAADLEATLRRLGIDSEGSIPSSVGHQPINTAIVGVTNDVFRASRDSHVTEMTEADLIRLRRLQYEEFVRRVRARRIEDVTARREKLKRQWKMEGELAASSVEMSQRNERALWIEKARAISKDVQEQAFEYLRGSVAAALHSEYTQRIHEGLNVLARQKLMDEDAKFAVVAAKQRTESLKAIQERASEAAEALARANADAKQDADEFCRRVSRSILELAVDVVNYNTERVARGAATLLSDPIPVTEWRAMVDRTVGSAVIVQPTTYTSTAATYVPNQPSLALSVLSPLTAARSVVVATPALSAGSRRTSKSVSQAAVDDRDALLRSQAEEVVSHLLDRVAEEDTAWLRTIWESTAKRLAHQSTEAEFDQLVENYNPSSPIGTLIFVGPLVQEVFAALEAAPPRASHDAAVLLRKTDLEAESAALVAAAEAELEQASRATKNKSGGKAKGEAIASEPSPEVAVPRPTPISLLAGKIRASAEHGAEGTTTPPCRTIIAGFSEAELLEAIQAAPGCDDSVAIIALQQSAKFAVRRLDQRRVGRRPDPAKVFEAMRTERQASAAPSALAAALRCSTSLLSRAAAVVQLDDELSADAILRRVTGMPSSDLRGLVASQALREHENSIFDSLRSFDDDLLRPLFKTLRVHELSAATAFRSAAKNIIDILEACNLPAQPPPDASATQQQSYWAEADRVRGFGLSSVSEILGECRAVFADVAAQRLHTATSIVTAAGDVIFSDETHKLALISPPSLEQCQKHMSNAMGEFTLLPSTTVGSSEREQEAYRAFLTETVAAVRRTFVSDGRDPLVEAKMLLWTVVSSCLVDFACDAHAAASWWYRDLLTASASWLERRLAASGSPTPQGVDALISIAGRVADGEQRNMVHTSKPANLLGAGLSRCLSVFAAKHLRWHGVLCASDPRRAILSAQVACCSIFASYETAADTLFLPCHQWWYAEQPPAPAAPVAVSVEEKPPAAAAESDTAPAKPVEPLQVVEPSRPVSRATSKAAGSRRAVTPSWTLHNHIEPPSLVPSTTPVPVIQEVVVTPSSAQQTPQPHLLPCRFGIYFPAPYPDSVTPLDCDWNDMCIALGLGCWTRVVHRSTAISGAPPPAFTTATIRTVGRQIGEALRPAYTSASAMIEAGSVSQRVFDSLDCWRKLDGSYPVVAALFELIAVHSVSAEVPVARIMRIVCNDTKSKHRTLENMFVFAHALTSLSEKHADSLPRPAVHALLPELDFDDFEAGSIFSSCPPAEKDAESGDMIRLRQLLAPWGLEVLADTSSKRLASVPIITFAIGVGVSESVN